MSEGKAKGSESERVICRLISKGGEGARDGREGGKDGTEEGKT